MSHAPHPQKFIVTDEYLLNYLLKKYQLDKQKLIKSIERTYEKEMKLSVIKKFYKQNKYLINRPFKEQYQYFKQWNNTGIYISKEELEDFFECQYK